jgi:hypothetical protein
MKTFVKKITLIVLFAYMLPFTGVLAQHESKEEHSHSEDSTEKLFGKVLESGSFEFHLRSYFMATVNQGDLTNYSTWGTGAGLGYFSPRWKGFGVGFSGFFVFRHFENNVTQLDRTTGVANRYEATLFDSHHLENHKDMDRLEEFFLSYLHKDWSAWIGRHKFESPLLNESDNRMRPNLFSGLSGEYAPGNWKFTGAWFTHVISRGSLEWLPVEESVGFYSTGRNPLGSSEDYHHHLNSKGIGVIGAEYAQENLKISSWNYLGEGLFGLSFLEATGKKSLSSGVKLTMGGQGFYQAALKDGGNPDPAKTYILPKESTFGAGFRLGLAWPHSEISLNYLGISDQGRFLFPREWGREKFFVSQQRERFEGMGGVNAVTLKIDRTFIHDQLMVSLAAGHVKTPNLNNLALNKYGLPNYVHLTGLVDYRFQGFFKGLDLQFLVAVKKEDDSGSIPKEYVINRVDMSNFNVILDYRF